MVLFSGGWCFFLLAAFYTVIDLMDYRNWSFPLRVIGMNSIAAYCMADGHIVKEFIVSSFKTHYGYGLLNMLDPAYQPFALGVVLLTVYWLILFWMYRRGTSSHLNDGGRPIQHSRLYFQPETIFPSVGSRLRCGWWFDHTPQSASRRRRRSCVS